MVLLASSIRRNGRISGYDVETAVVRGAPRTTVSSEPFPRWKSRFAKSSGYEPERDGQFAPPLDGQSNTKRASDQDAIQSDPPAADAA